MNIENLKKIMNLKINGVYAVIIILLCCGAFLLLPSLQGSSSDSDKNTAIRQNPGIPDLRKSQNLQDDIYADPFAEMRMMHERMQKIFESAFGYNDSFMREPTLLRFPLGTDISENKESYLIRMDIPGVDKQDIDISIRDNSIIVSGKRDRETEQRSDDRLLSYGRSYGQFTRICQIPGAFDKTKVKAKYENGVLTLTVPKTEKEVSNVKVTVD